MSVFVWDRNKRPLMPCSEKRARLLLERGRARIHKMVPFTIRLIDREVADCDLQELSIKIDPGSKTTGLALVRKSEQVDSQSGEITKAISVLSLIEIVHRGRQISESLTARSQMRRRRRGNLRYRAPRFNNRTKPKGWLAPSLQHRIGTTMAWVKRLRRWAPVTSLSQELVRFDMQLIQNPEISGVEYQQGTLAGYELREYALAKWGRTCAYCDKTDVPLQIEHIVPRAAGGSNRASNLTLACEYCNQKKAAKSLKVFLAKDPLRLKRIESQAKAPLKDAAAVNSTRWALANALKATGIPLELASGGRTKFNRSRLGIPKTHALDAVCVGLVEQVCNWQQPTLSVKCTGRGSYQRTRLDKFGFPRGYLIRKKQAFGFQTGDLVKADVPKGKRAGCHKGRVAIRARGSFNIQTPQGLVTDISHKNFRLLQRADGYSYQQMKGVAPSPLP